MSLTFGSLFAGIGGFDLGFERAGMKCRWQVEIDPFCQKVLAKHWPDVGRWDDVRTFPPSPPEDWAVDVICGGFPCQDISEIKQDAAGLYGERSGLWAEYRRIIGDIGPGIAVLENVSALTFRGLGAVLSDLSELGFDAEWQTLPASAFGAPHGRDRVFVVAYSASVGCVATEVFSEVGCENGIQKSELRGRHWPGIRRPSETYPDRLRWCPDSELCGVVNGIPDEPYRYHALGNAVVPQIAEWIGRRIIEAAGAAP